MEDLHKISKGDHKEKVNNLGKVWRSAWRCKKFGKKEKLIDIELLCAFLVLRIVFLG